MTWKIYSLIDPRDGRVRYVGKTGDIKKRLYDHVRDALRSQQRNHRLNWIRSLVEGGQLPTLAIIESGEGAWQAAEKHWIAFYRMAGMDLVNATDGGEGGRAGYRLSAETRAKLSAAHKGHVHSAEHRAKLSAAAKGHTRTAEHRAKLSAVNKGRVWSAETRAKIGAAAKARWQSPEVRAKIRAKISVAHRALWKNPEYRAKMRAANKDKYSSPETREKMRAAWIIRKSRAFS